MGFDPTAEQDAAIAAFRTGQHIALEAGAGTGKTSTLRLLASAVPAHANGRPRTGIYMAYNASIAKQAAREFPANTVCKTGHAHTMRALNPIQRARLFDMPRQHAGDHARILRAQDPARISPDVVFSPRQIASAAMETITWFCRSGDTELKARHVPHRNRIESPSDRATLARIVLPFAQRAWNDITSTGGLLKWEHDYYRKMFHLNGGRLDGDFLFLDEAQDSNGVTIAIVRAHQAAGMRVVAVGDRCQSINGWMGAVDAMDAFNGARLQLSKSFRFGPAIAAEANKWLTLLGSDLSISGHEPVGSKVGNLRGNTIPDAILTRKNATAVAEAMRLLDTGVKVALVKTVGDQIKRLAEAAQQLKARGSTDHPELCAFESWGQVQDYCLAPGTRVLTKDLRWQAIELCEAGDELVAFDEHVPSGSRGRRFRTTRVEAVRYIERPSYRVAFDDGTEVVASAEHRWLSQNEGVNKTQGWRATEDLTVGRRVMSIGRPWEQDMTRDGGWLAGMYDGEGHCGGGYENSRNRMLVVSQKAGPVLDQIMDRLKARGFDFDNRPRARDAVHQIYVRGGLPEQLRLLGELRPERLIAKAHTLWEDRQVGRIRSARVTSIEFLGSRPVVAMRTDSHTFIAEGLLSHNCEFDHGGSDLKVFVKLVDEHTPEKIIGAMRRLSPAEDAQVTISTAHRAKGLEWDRVRIADDFDPPEGEDEYGRPKMPTREDMMLAYVAVTRAKKVLDPGGLAWVDRFLAAHVRGNDRVLGAAVADMERSVGVRHGRYLRDAV